MNLQSLAVVVLRLIALNFALSGVIQTFPYTLQVLRVFNDSPAYAAVPLVVIVGLLAGAIWLWVCAVPIARLVTQRLPSEVSLGAISLADCYSIAFVGVGLFYLVGHLAQVLTWAHYLLRLAVARPGTPLVKDVEPYAVIQVFVPFVVGLVLLVKARVWAAALAARHAYPRPPRAPVGDSAAGGDGGS